MRWPVPAFLALALLAGGGGSPAPAAELVLQLGFAACLAALVWQGQVGPPSPRALLVLALALLAVPLVQLVPLPPEWWRALPGREQAARALDLAGAGRAWRPVSLVPAATLAGALALVPPLGLMFLASRASLAERRALLLVTAGAGLAGVLLGALQVTGGSWRLYHPTHVDWLTGFFANRNAAAVQFVLSGLALSAWGTGVRNKDGRHGRERGALLGMAQGVLALGVVLTGSRAGFVLLVLSLPLHWLIWRSGGERKGFSNGAQGARWLIPGAVAALLGLAVLAGPAGARLLARFAPGGEGRFELWTDSWRAAIAYWPAGAGLGTFPSAFGPFERLETVDATRPNRAHSEYLEYLVEAGALAPLVLVIGGVCLWRLARAGGWSGAAAAPRCFAAGALALLALHAILDYPLRNMALACVAGLCAGLLAGGDPPRPRGAEG